MLRESKRRCRATRAASAEAGLVVALVFALLAAPAVNALRSECDLCPPDCPMHHGATQNGPAAHLGCHHSATHSPHPSEPSDKPVLGCASCGNHSLLPGSVLPPMLLPDGCAIFRYETVGTACIPDGALNSRGVDPPDTPPPISTTCVA
jgi:hypothetical protein